MFNSATLAEVYKKTSTPETLLCIIDDKILWAKQAAGIFKVSYVCGF